jgi:fructose-bisphosphate aldolase class II
VAGFNIFGLDEACRVVAAAERTKQPVIIMTNKELVRAIPVEVLAPALQALAERASVPVCVHLDHTYELSQIERAIHAGYSSVMYDGSQLPFTENLATTLQVVQIARRFGVSVEGEIGSVSYNEVGNTIRHELTNPAEAAQFAEETGVDAVAISVGTIHKLTEPRAHISRDLLTEIFNTVATPLVIHGTSGVNEEDLRFMAAGRVAKFNIGTNLRRAWGRHTAKAFARHPGEFDRLTLTAEALEAIEAEAVRMITLLASPESR